MKITHLFIVILLILTSCTEETDITSNNNLEISAISSANSFIYDTVTIYGTGFGLEEIELNSSSEIFDYEVISFSNTEFTFVPLSHTELIEISFFVDGVKSNSLPFSVSLTPIYDTTFIESGIFEMGSITGFSDESPVHEVTLTNDLYVFRNEVTNLLWYHIMDTLVTPTKLRDYPKDSISWQESILFANRLSMIYGFEPAYTINNDLVEYNMESNGWRLPTEAEWEFICKGNSEEDFSGTGDINEMGYYDSNSGLNKHKVGEKKANENGLYDVHGNLWEWCWDFYSETYYSTMSQVDPLGPSNGIRHVLRGGSFQDGFNYARSTNRSIKKIDLNAIGLRLVRNAK